MLVGWGKKGRCGQSYAVVSPERSNYCAYVLAVLCRTGVTSTREFCSQNQSTESKPNEGVGWTGLGTTYFMNGRCLCSQVSTVLTWEEEVNTIGVILLPARKAPKAKVLRIHKKKKNPRKYSYYAFPLVEGT